MKVGLSLRSIIAFFSLILGLYFALFYAIEHGSRRAGGWELEFSSDATGKPAVVIQQPNLKIRNVTLVFKGEIISQTNLSQRMRFEQPFTSFPFKLPIGEIIYEDLRSFPGVITLNFFGHEVELLPRVLIVDKRESPWRSGNVIELYATNKPVQPPKPPKGWEAPR